VLEPVINNLEENDTEHVESSYSDHYGDIAGDGELLDVPLDRVTTPVSRYY
jgi:hypothetical protein